jgi:hypothetical protein
MQMLGRAVSFDRMFRNAIPLIAPTCRDGPNSVNNPLYHSILHLTGNWRISLDREGIAIIMCDKNLENKYKLLATEGSPLESTLHHNLTEHINSEIGLGENIIFHLGSN